MEKQNEDLNDAALLRQQAEERLKKQQSKTASVSSEADMLKLIHELEVHQIELEMQNEELVIAKEKAEFAEGKYTVLYDFASASYLSLTKEGKITELNFAAAQMLGKKRLHLIKNKFDLFLSVKTRPVFNLFLEKVFTRNVNQSCEVTIVPHDNSAVVEQVLPIDVTINAIVSQNDEICLLTLTDITERKQAELIIQKKTEAIEAQNEELVELNATRDKIFNIISHDLKGPFNTMLGFSNLLLQNIDKYDKNEIKQFAKAISEAGKNTFKLLENLLNSTDIATLFLDKKLNIRRFTDQLNSLFKLRQTDIGKPFTDLVTDLQYPDIKKHANEVLRTLVFKETDISTRDQRWFKVRIMPYRTFDDHIDGLVITFIDITKAKKIEAELAIVNKEKNKKADSELITADKEVDILRREKEKLEVELKKAIKILKEHNLYKP